MKRSAVCQGLRGFWTLNSAVVIIACLKCEAINYNMHSTT